MATKNEAVTVKRDEAVSDGDGGYYKKGDKIECPSADTADSLRAKDLVE